MKDSSVLVLAQVVGFAAVALVLRLGGATVTATLMVLGCLGALLVGLTGWYLRSAARAASSPQRPAELGGAAASGTPYATPGRPIGPHATTEPPAQRSAGAHSYANEPSFDLQGASGRYRFVRRLGAGGMGHVYLAEETRSGVHVVVKLMRDELASMSNLRRRFGREVRALQRSESPFVMKVLDFGTQKPNDIPFIVTNYIEGKDLDEELSEHPILPMPEVVALATQLAAAIDSSHATGVLHRDIKPSNVILTRPTGADPRFTLIDFGLSKVVDVDDTMTNGAIGTPRYMAPEQALGESVDGRADVYGLAAILYRVIVGREAILATELGACLRSLMFRQPDRPGGIVQVSEQVEAVLAVGLAKRAEDRFGTAGELAASFQAALRDRLAPSTMNRARKLLAHHPWGSWGEAQLDEMTFDEPPASTVGEGGTTVSLGDLEETVDPELKTEPAITAAS